MSRLKEHESNASLSRELAKTTVFSAPDWYSVIDDNPRASPEALGAAYHLCVSLGFSSPSAVSSVLDALGFSKRKIAAAGL